MSITGGVEVGKTEGGVVEDKILTGVLVPATLPSEPGVDDALPTVPEPLEPEPEPPVAVIICPTPAGWLTTTIETSKPDWELEVAG